MGLPFLRNADVNVKRNELSLPTLTKEYLLFNLEKGLSLGLLDLPSFSMAFKLISLLEINLILGMGTSKLKRSVKLPDFVKMFFEVLSRKPF